MFSLEMPKFGSAFWLKTVCYSSVSSSQPHYPAGAGAGPGLREIFLVLSLVTENGQMNLWGWPGVCRSFVIVII